MEPIQAAPEYHFNERDESVLDELLTQLESRVGGTRVHRGLSAGSIDLLSALEVVVETAVASYVVGLLGIDELSKEHKKWLMEQVSRLASLLNQIAVCTKDRIRELNLKAAYDDKEQAITVRIDLDGIPCYIALNGPHVDADALSRLDIDVKAMIESIRVCAMPEDIVALQLCLHPATREWRYLLLPSPDAFGQFVDRVFDIHKREFMNIDSAAQFIELVQIEERDSLKVLINPFRGRDRSKAVQFPE